MNPVTILIIIGLLSVVGMIALAFFFYIKKLRQEIAVQAMAVDGIFHERIDTLPYLVEVLRKHMQVPGYDKIVATRGMLLNAHDLTQERLQQEAEITKSLTALLQSEKQTPALMHDLHYLELKKEYETLAQKIEKTVNTYNATVELLQGLAKKIPLQNLPSFIGHTR